MAISNGGNPKTITEFNVFPYINGSVTNVEIYSGKDHKNDVKEIKYFDG